MADAFASHPLDRVIWNSLTSRHAGLAEGGDLARRYPARIGPLAAVREETPEAFAALAALAPAGDRVGLLSREPLALQPAFSVAFTDAIDQMVLTGPVPAATEAAFDPLGPTDVPEMKALADLTRPGPFSHDTHELGSYLGLRAGGELIAMAGYRMHLDGFREISAVCVHPGHRGRGHAAALVVALARSIAAAGETPFLHVLSSNAPAIPLYLKLGFALHRTLRFTLLERR